MLLLTFLELLKENDSVIHYFCETLTFYAAHAIELKEYFFHFYIKKIIDTPLLWTKRDDI